MKIAIKDIINSVGDPITPREASKFISIDELYTFCKSLKLAWDRISDRDIQETLAELITRIKIAYYYKILQEGGKLNPIRLKGNLLIDGRRRLWAHLLDGATEVEYIE